MADPSDADGVRIHSLLERMLLPLLGMYQLSFAHHLVLFLVLAPFLVPSGSLPMVGSSRATP